jgi:hypothetical protein
MGCGCCGDLPNDRFQPEYNKRWKPENNSGCDCGGSNRNTCDSPSLARKGSALARFEEIYGKVVTKVSFVQDAQGHTVQVVEKTLCPLKVEQKSRHGCCSLRYRVQR